MRSLLTATLGLSVAVLAVAADPPAERAEALAKLKRAAKAQEAHVDKALEDVKSDEEREKIVTEGQKQVAALTAKGLKLAADAPADEVAFAAALWVVETGPSEHKDDAKTLLLKHHLASPRLKSAVRVVNDNDLDALPFLREVGAKAADTEAKGLALLLVGQALTTQADDAGKDVKKAAGLLKEAEGLLDRAKALAPDLPVTEKATLGVLADDELFAIRKLSVGSPAPDFEAADLDGKKAKLSGFKGKVVVLDLWATWCGPCVAMIPENRELVKKYADRPFVFLSVSADDEADTVRAFQKKTAMPWPNWWNGPEGGVLDAYKIKFFPSVYVIDAKGVIRYKHVRGDDLADVVAELVKEAEGK